MWSLRPGAVLKNCEMLLKVAQPSKENKGFGDAQPRFKPILRRTDFGHTEPHLSLGVKWGHL